MAGLGEGGFVGCWFGWFVVMMLGLLEIASLISWSVASSLCVKVGCLGGGSRQLVVGVAQVWWTLVWYCPYGGLGKIKNMPFDFINQGCM